VCFLFCSFFDVASHSLDVVDVVVVDDSNGFGNGVGNGFGFACTGSFSGRSIAVTICGTLKRRVFAGVGGSHCEHLSARVIAGLDRLADVDP